MDGVCNRVERYSINQLRGVYELMSSNQASGNSLNQIQWACFLCFAFTIIAVPSMLASKPDLEYYALRRVNDTGMPVVEYHSSMKSYTLLLLFLLPSVIEHLFAIVYKTRYARLLSGIGWHRWLSYAISAPSLVGLVIYSIGPGSEFSVSLLTSGLILVCIGMGPIVEYGHGGFDDLKRNPFIFKMGMLIGFVALLFAFVPVWYYYSKSDVPSDIAPFVGAMVAVITVLYWCFGFVPLYLYAQEPPFYKREMVYCTLSLCAKLPLAWLYAAMLATRF